ncbi:MAG TPA: DUF167 domain-containing protein [Candidatus Saccharimonadia bacterium]
MKLGVRVKAGAHRDGLWREGDGLFVQIRAVPQDGQANEYLVKFLSGSLRVSRSLIKLVRGHTSTHKLIEIDAPEADLRPMLNSLPPVPQARLFDD